MLARIVRKVVQVHPPEADAMANAFGEAHVDAQAVLLKLLSLYGSLDPEWEGDQKARFMIESEAAIARFADILLPGLTSWEKKYRVLMTDQIIETMEYY